MARQASRPRPAADGWLIRFVRNLLLWLVPVWVAWALATPLYNRFLIEASENLVRLGERPAVTRLQVRPPHHLVITRSDVGRGLGLPTTVRVTDVHFPLVLLGLLFLAVPGVRLVARLQRLGWALLITVFFHLADLVFWVEFVYATQLGAWSQAHYGPFARNFWGLGKHLLDLPFKLGLPLALWAWFFLGELRRREAG